MKSTFQKPIGFAFAFVMCIFISGCSETDTADVALCRERLSNVIHGFETNCSFDNDELLDALDMVSAVENKAQMAMLLGEFEDEGRTRPFWEEGGDSRSRKERGR